MKAFRKIYARNGFKTLDRIWIGDLKECQEVINLDIERFESVGYRKISDRILSRESNGKKDRIEYILKEL